MYIVEVWVTGTRVLYPVFCSYQAYRTAVLYPCFAALRVDFGGFPWNSLSPPSPSFLTSPPPSHQDDGKRALARLKLRSRTQVPWRGFGGNKSGSLGFSGWRKARFSRDWSSTGDSPKAESGRPGFSGDSWWFDVLGPSKSFYMGEVMYHHVACVITM